MAKIALPEDVTAMREPLHLSYEEITAFMDGTAEARQKERAEAHLFLCTGCTRELEGLRRMDEQLAMPFVVPKQVKAPPTPILKRMAQFFTISGRAPQLGYALGAIIAGIAVLIKTEVRTATSSGAAGAARVVDMNADLHQGLSLGGIALVVVGTVYLIYVLLKKR
jgi:anti-sigma factor RsiW